MNTRHYFKKKILLYSKLIGTLRTMTKRTFQFIFSRLSLESTLEWNTLQVDFVPTRVALVAMAAMTNASGDKPRTRTDNRNNYV